MKFRSFFLLAVLLAAIQGLAQPAFTDVSAAAGILSVPGSTGVAIADFNNDGWEDLYVSFINRKNQLYKNLGDGTFVEIAKTAGVDVDGYTIAATWGDINNDGYPDLYVGNHGVSDQLFLNNGDETFKNISVPAGIYQVGTTMSVNMADVNNDGYLDIYVCNFLSENALYLNRGNNTFANAIWPSRAFDSGKSMGAVFFDYDKDGDPDLYLVHDGNEPNFLYQNDGKGVFTEVGQSAGANTRSNGMGVDAGDINNDGYPDLYITNLYANILLLNNGNGTFSDITESAGVGDYGMGWGVTFIDFDNDGWLDIYAVNDYAFSPYPNVLYRNRGDLTFEKVETDGPVSNRDDSYGTACFDYNLDGYPDLVVANRSTNEQVQLFRNAERPGNWIGVKLVGVQSNRDAIGAKIRLTDNRGVVHYKELLAGHGWTSQNSTVVHIGLGAADAIESLQIYWPSGLEQAVDSLELNTFYTIEEGAAPHPGLHPPTPTPAREPGGAAGFDVAVFPNPYSGGPVRLALTLPAPAPLAFQVFDGFGRLLLAQQMPVQDAGMSTFFLDPGTFPAPALAGVMMIRVANSDKTVVKKLILDPN